MTSAKQAVILAGGKGTRLRPLTNTRPKPLLPVLGRPCVEYVIRALAEAGVEEIFLTCGYRSQDMVDALGDGRQFGVNIIMCFEESPAGTAGAVKLLEDRLEDTFIVASGDVLADVDMRSLVERHRHDGAVATMALTTVDRPEEFGIVGLDEDGRIIRFKEKPRTEEVFSNLINAGIYVLEREVLPEIPMGEMYDFSKQLFPRLLAAGRPLFGALLNGLWKDIGRPRDLLDANIQMAERKGQHIEAEGARCRGNIVADYFSASDSCIDGPVYIGKGAILGRSALLSSCAVGKEVEVDASSIIEDSFIMDRCSIGKGCVVRGSLLGKDCSIDDNVTLLNCILGDGVRVNGPAMVEDQMLE